MTAHAGRQDQVSQVEPEDSRPPDAPHAIGGGLAVVSVSGKETIVLEIATIFDRGAFERDSLETSCSNSSAVVGQLSQQRNLAILANPGVPSKLG